MNTFSSVSCSCWHQNKIEGVMMDEMRSPAGQSDANWVGRLDPVNPRHEYKFFFFPIQQCIDIIYYWFFKMENWTDTWTLLGLAFSGRRDAWVSITGNPLAHCHFGVKWTMFCTFCCLPPLNMSKAHCHGELQSCAILLEAISNKYRNTFAIKKTHQIDWTNILFQLWQ